MDAAPAGAPSTTSTSDVLDAVRAQSQWLAGGPVATPSWGPAEWRSAFESLFLATDPAAGGGDQDDMLFFVRGDGDAAESKEPVFVRRWSRELPRDLACAWRESVYLNLVAHSRFTLTVAVCSYAGLRDRTRPGPRTLLKRVRAVYAAPSVARVDLRTRKAAAQQSAWPDVYFAVHDGLDEEGAALTDADHCLVVELRAWGGVARESTGAGPLGEGAPNVSLFAGLVASDALQTAFRRLAAAPRFGATRPTERVVMAGPGGRGRVEVAVTEAKGGGVECAVMSVCMPWDALARDVLLSGST